MKPFIDKDGRAFEEGVLLRLNPTETLVFIIKVGENLAVIDKTGHILFLDDAMTKSCDIPTITFKEE